MLEQGHCCGVDTRWNKGDSYNRAVTNKTIILQDLFSKADNDTVFMYACRCCPRGDVVSESSPITGTWSGVGCDR